MKQRAKEYYKENKEKIKERHANWYTENKTQQQQYALDYHSKHYLRQLINNSRARALERALEHSIIESDLDIPKYCPYLGIKLTTIRGQGKVDSNASLDRIDPTKGYTKDNIQIISWLANKMKSNVTEEVLVEFAKGVLRKHKGIDIQC